MDQLILHHYPQSPVSEKVRVGLGIKNIAWKSVEIPRIPPKPDLMPLTGGYRRTPVLQSGAEVYCDSHCILREIERRFPEPSYYQGSNEGLVWALAAWTDSGLFDLAVKLVLGGAVDQLPADFADDRGRLYFGPSWDLKAFQLDQPHLAAQLRGQLAHLDQLLAAGQSFVLGDRPGLADALTYYLVWFLRGRWQPGPDLLAGFPRIEAWEVRVQALGHGRPSEMTSATALEIARDAEPTTPASVDPADPQGLQPGQEVTVEPDGDGGDPAVTGRLHVLEKHSVAILRSDERIGRVCVHFPRVGYRVSAI